MKGALFVVFVLVAISWQQVSAGQEKTITVASEKTPCNGPFPRFCYRVKEEGSEEFGTVYYGIIGFDDYEAGNEYLLKVNVEDVPNPPPDASAVKYTLLEVVSKTKV